MAGGSTARDLARWMKGALGIRCLSLKRLSVEGFFIGDPGL
jgi:hypothetical protein